MRKYSVFAIVAIPVFMGSLDATIVAVAFPTMVTRFGTSLVAAGWVLSIYTLVSIGAIPIASKLSDTRGRRSTFVGCLILFTAGSLLCAIAPNMGWLIFFRAIQAAGGGGFISTASGILVDELPDQRQQTIGLLSAISNIGAIAGPNIGGIMVEYLGWQSIFWLNVPFGIVALVLARYLIKSDVKWEAGTDLDYLGVGLMIGFISAMMLSLTFMERAYNVGPVIIVGLALVAVILLVLFIRRSKKHPGGVVSWNLLNRRPFIAANFYSFIFGACSQNGISSLMPLFATSVYGLSVIQSGLIITPRSLGVIVASVIASFALPRSGYRRPLAIGALTMILGWILLGLEPGAMTLAGINLSGAAVITLLALVVGIGIGIAAPASNNACIELMPDKVASITGLRQLSTRTGGALSIAASTLILESSADIGRGFTIVFIGFSCLMLTTLIAVIYMPEITGR